MSKESVGHCVIQSPEALYALVVAVQLGVELMEVGDGGEYDAHSGVGLTVQFLKQNTIRTPDSADHSKQYNKKDLSIFLHFIVRYKNVDLQKVQIIKKVIKNSCNKRIYRHIYQFMRHHIIVNGTKHLQTDIEGRPFDGLSLPCSRD